MDLSKTEFIVKRENSKVKDPRSKIKLIVFFVFLVSGLFACSEQSKTKHGVVIADSNSYAATIFKQNCAICHGKEAYGKMVDGKFVPSLRYGDAEKKTKEEIYEQIAHGKLPMPAFEDQLTESEMRQMVDFIMYDLQGRERKPDNSAPNAKN